MPAPENTEKRTGCLTIVCGSWTALGAFLLMTDSPMRLSIFLLGFVVAVVFWIPYKIGALAIKGARAQTVEKIVYVQVPAAVEAPKSAEPVAAPPAPVVPRETLMKKARAAHDEELRMAQLLPDELTRKAAINQVGKKLRDRLADLMA